MVEKHTMPRITLRYDGIFDIEGLYVAVTDWARNYAYIWTEGQYKHKVPRPAGAEQEIRWILDKNVTEYISYNIKIDIHMWDLKDVEVEIEGRKKTFVNAKVDLIIQGTLMWDWQNTFAGKGKFAELLGKWYEHRLLRQIETIYWDQLHYRTWNLHAVIKKYFDMQKGIHAYKGYLGES